MAAGGSGGGGGSARDKSPPPTPKSPSSAKGKGKGKGKGKDRAGAEEAVKDEEDDGDDGFGDDDAGGGAGMMEFGGGDEDDDDDDDGGTTPFSPPSGGAGGAGSDGGDGDESEKEGGRDVSSPVTRAAGKAKEKTDQKKPAAARKSKKRAGDQHPHHRKGKSVVARLSVGRRKRTAAPAAATPGPPRRTEGPRFVEMSEVAGKRGAARCGDVQGAVGWCVTGCILKRPGATVDVIDVGVDAKRGRAGRATHFPVSLSVVLLVAVSPASQASNQDPSFLSFSHSAFFHAASACCLCAVRAHVYPHPPTLPRTRKTLTETQRNSTRGCRGEPHPGGATLAPAARGPAEVLARRQHPVRGGRRGTAGGGGHRQGSGPTGACVAAVQVSEERGTTCQGMAWHGMAW